MIEGIEILNQSEVMTTPLWADILLVVGIAGTVGFLLATLLTEAGWKTIVFGLLTLISMGSAVVGGCHDQSEPSGRYRYECTIDESVSMTRMYEKYDIIEQRGKIWVLEDKEGEK